MKYEEHEILIERPAIAQISYQGSMSAYYFDVITRDGLTTYYPWASNPFWVYIRPGPRSILYQNDYGEEYFEPGFGGPGAFVLTDRGPSPVTLPEGSNPPAPELVSNLSGSSTVVVEPGLYTFGLFASATKYDGTRMDITATLELFPVPEPVSFVLLGIGGLAFIFAAGSSLKRSSSRHS